MFKPDILHFETLESTNDLAKQMLRDNTAREGMVIWADAQTRGRGRMGRRWFSSPGNLFFSVIINPRRSLTDVAQVSFLSAVAMGEVLKPLLGHNGKVTYKWPNDVLVEGQKICGILLETEFSTTDSENPYVVIGVGLNIDSSPEFVSFPATRLKSFVTTPPSIEELLNQFLEKFGDFYYKWYEYGFDPIREKWLESAHGLGELITLVVHNQPLVARFDGIDNNGFLHCTDEWAQTHKLSSAEVMFM